MAAANGLWLLALCSVACAAEGRCGSTASPAQPPRGAASSVRWLPPLEVAAGRAQAGPWRMNDSTFDYVDDGTVALSDSGELVVAWADNRQKDVMLRKYAADGTPLLSKPSNVSRTPEVFSWLPRLVVSQDAIFVLWQEIIFSGGSHGGDICFARSLDAGETFGPPLNLSRSTGGDGKGRLDSEHWDNGSLDLVRDASGALLAAWTEYDGGLWFSRSGDRGESFSMPLRVGGSQQQPARAPALARFEQRDLYLVWASGEKGRGSLSLSRSLDGGQSFEPPRALLAGSAQLDAPKLAVDPQGAVHLVYTERESDAAPSTIRYTRSRDGARSFEPPRSLLPAPGQGSFASLAFAAPATLAVAWLHQASRSAPPQGLALAVSRDGGERFSAAELVPHTADPSLGVTGSRQGKLMRLLTLSGAGNLALVHSTFHEGEQSRVRVLRGRL